MNLATGLVLAGTIFCAAGLFTDIRNAAFGGLLIGVGVLVGALP